jgi:hypothetical protein
LKPVSLWVSSFEINLNKNSKMTTLQNSEVGNDIAKITWKWQLDDIWKQHGGKEQRKFRFLFDGKGL